MLLLRSALVQHILDEFSQFRGRRFHFRCKERLGETSSEIVKHYHIVRSQADGRPRYASGRTRGPTCPRTSNGSCGTAPHDSSRRRRSAECRHLQLGYAGECFTAGAMFHRADAGRVYASLRDTVARHALQLSSIRNAAIIN